MYRSFTGKTPLISNAVSVVGSHLHCGCWSWCRRNSWCCNRISDYINLLSNPWHTKVFTSKRWLNSSGPSSTPVLAEGKPIAAFSVSRGGCSPQKQAVDTAPALLLFDWDGTLIGLVLPFFTIERKREGVWGAVCGTLPSPLLSSLQFWKTSRKAKTW